MSGHVSSLQGQPFARDHSTTGEHPRGARRWTRTSARPTGTRSAAAATLTSRGGRPAPRADTSRRRTGIRARWPTSASARCAAAPPRASSSARSTGSAAALARPFQEFEVSAPPPRSRWCVRPTGRGPSEPPHDVREPRCAACAHVLSFMGHPLPRAHLSVSRWPASAAFTPVQTSHGHPFARAHFNVSRRPWTLRRDRARPAVPRALVQTQIFQQPSGGRARRPPCTVSGVPTNTRSRAPTSTSGSTRLARPRRPSSSPTGIRSRAPTGASRRWPPLAAAAT